MRRITSILLLGAGIILSLAGCQKGTTSDNSGKTIKFGALTGAPTRTAYSGEGTTVDNQLTWERIDWVDGDQVMIGSDKALGRQGGTNNYATYRIFGIQPDGNISKASIADDEGKGLVWGDNADEAYTFYGVYPASAGDANLADGSVTFTVATPQAPKDNKPDMDQAVMLAMLSGAKPSDKSVDLQFYPAYTAFEFVLTAANTDVNLTKVELVSDSDLVGTVTATIAEGTTTNSAGQTIGASSFSDPTDAGKVLTYNFPSGTKVTKDGDPLTFTVFALPVDVVKLKVKFYTNDTDYQSATLKSKADGENIKFDACRKHKIYGLAIPDGQWHLYLEADVLDWIEATKTIQYGNATADGVVVSASALEPITGATSWSRTAATVPSASFVKAYYSVYSPTNGKWRITLKGANASKFTIETDPEGTTGTNADGEPYIEGNVNGRIIFTLTPNGAASGDSVELWFTVVYGGKEYLLHSEVTRSNSPLTVTVQ